VDLSENTGHTSRWPFFLGKMRFSTMGYPFRPFWIRCWGMIAAGITAWTGPKIGRLLTMISDDLMSTLD
jgi:hypothetical protein